MVLVDKLPWCTHKGNPIYSLHIQQNGTRFATGASDSKVKVWSLLAAMDARQESKSEVPKLLATLTDHNGPVNVVRFSHGGRLLASGSDDRMACIYELRPGAGGGVLGSDTPNVENWRTKCVLRGHVNNVVDLVWSPDDTRLVTVSLETRIMVWDTASGLCIKVLEGHNSFVKGVAWDPVGTYIATHSEDKKVMVWRTDDWSIVAAIDSPFTRMVTSTFSCRLSWSPDGRYLVAGNSYQGTMHSAVVVPREAWNKTDQYMLINGHQRAVVAPLFSPRLFHLPQADGSGYAENLSSVFALGSQDRLITVWNASANRAVFAAKLFKAQVTDMSWTADGRSLLVCSGDGSVAVVQFATEELGKGASEQEMQEVMKALYGSAAGGKGGKRVLAESAEQLFLEERLEEAAAQAAPQTTAADQPSTGVHKGTAPAAAAAAAPSAPAAAAAMAALNARLGGDMGNGTTQVGFGAGAGPGAHAALAPSRAMELAAPRPPQRIAPPARRELAPVAPAGPAAKRAKLAGPAAYQAAPLHFLPLPRLQTEVRVALGRSVPLLGGAEGSQQTVHELCVTNRERGLGHQAQCHIECKKGGKEVWKDVLLGTAIAAAGTFKYGAVAMMDGSLLVYSPAGRRLAPPIKLGAGIAVLASAGSWQLLVVTTSGSLRLFDVQNIKCTLECSLVSLLEEGYSVMDVKLSESGVPLVTLTNSHAYVWHKGLGSWICVADDGLASSIFAPLAGLTGQGELGSLQAQALGSRPAVGGSSTSAHRHSSRAHLEGNIAAALALGGEDEYRRAVVAYARLLTEEGDAGRLTELCDSLIGGGEGWEPVVLGISKRELLRREVLREMARNRDLGGLLQRMATCLDDLDAAITV